VKSDEDRKKKRKKLSESGRKKISERVTVLMDYLEITSTELSQACDMSVEYISRLKNGKVDPRDSTLSHIIREGFEISEKEFHDYDNLPEKPKKKHSSK